MSLYREWLMGKELPKGNGIYDSSTSHQVKIAHNDALGRMTTNMFKKNRFGVIGEGINSQHVHRNWLRRSKSPLDFWIHVNTYSKVFNNSTSRIAYSQLLSSFSSVSPRALLYTEWQNIHLRHELRYQVVLKRIRRRFSRHRLIPRIPSGWARRGHGKGGRRGREIG